MPPSVLNELSEWPFNVVCLTHLTQHIVSAPHNVLHPMLFKMTNKRVNKESEQRESLYRVLAIAVESVTEEGKI